MARMPRSGVPLLTLILIAATVMLASRPASGATQAAVPADTSAIAAAPVVEIASPFPLLAIWDPWDWRDETNLLQPVDPVTFEPLPGYVPIEIERPQAGGYVETAVSPDGTTAVLVTHIPSSSMEPGMIKLHVVDLMNWTDVVAAEWSFATGYSSALNSTFSADGATIFWIARSIGSGERSLHRMQLATGAQEKLATLPEGFVAIDHRVSFDERTWYVFGTPVQHNLPTDNGYVLGEFAAGDAQLLTVDLGSGEILSTIELVGVEAGGVPLDDIEGDGYPVRSVSPGLDWDLSAGRLYIGYNGDGWMQGAALDLANGSVPGVYTYDEGAAWLDRLAAWLVPTAHAVVRGLSWGHALSLNGGELAAYSSAWEDLNKDRSNLESATHGPVWAVDTTTGQQVWQSHLGAIHAIAESPVGDRLLVHAANRIFLLDAVSNDEGQTLFLLDSATGDVVERLDLPGRPSHGKQSMIVTAEHVYIRTTTESGREVIVVNPADLSIVGGWGQADGEPSLYKLIPLP